MVLFVKKEKMIKDYVPKNKILLIPITKKNININKKYKIVKPLNLYRKREWFTSHFYKCLPLSIGNMQGFSVSLPFELNLIWNGGLDNDSIHFNFLEQDKEIIEDCEVYVSSHFGNGIFTVNLPFIIKTPSEVNIMTTSPPNYPLPGLSPLCGVVETDNLKYTFSLNIKVDIPNVWIKILPNSPIIGILPIPRLFCDQFDIIDDINKMDSNFVKDQKEVAKEHAVVRDFLSTLDTNGLDKTYFNGTDIRGNKFFNHQLPINCKDKN
jgi:hypothetical protein